MWTENSLMEILGRSQGEGKNQLIADIAVVDIVEKGLPPTPPAHQASH